MTSVPFPPAHPVGRPTGWWGMLLLVFTEGALFATLLASYFYLGFGADRGWPPPGIDDPKLLKPAIMTALLMASAVTVLWAERGIRRDDTRALRLWLAVTLVLGFAFLGLQALEYHEKLALFRPSDHAYAALFYTITSLHATHVIAGLLLLGWTQLFAWRGAYRAERHVAVAVAALYWHFVHVVWLFVFLSLYLSPRL